MLSFFKFENLVQVKNKNHLVLITRDLLIWPEDHIYIIKIIWRFKKKNKKEELYFAEQ